LCTISPAEGSFQFTTIRLAIAVGVEPFACKDGIEPDAVLAVRTRGSRVALGTLSAGSTRVALGTLSACGTRVALCALCAGRARVALGTLSAVGAGSSLNSFRALSARYSLRTGRSLSAVLAAFVATRLASGKAVHILIDKTVRARILVSAVTLAGALQAIILAAALRLLRATH